MYPNCGFPDCARLDDVKCDEWKCTYEKEERGKAEAKDEGSGEVRIVHDMLVNAAKRVQNRHGLGTYVREVDAEF